MQRRRQPPRRLRQQQAPFLDVYGFDRRSAVQQRAIRPIVTGSIVESDASIAKSGDEAIYRQYRVRHAAAAAAVAATATAATAAGAPFLDLDLHERSLRYVYMFGLDPIGDRAAQPHRDARRDARRGHLA